MTLTKRKKPMRDSKLNNTTPEEWNSLKYNEDKPDPLLSIEQRSYEDEAPKSSYELREEEVNHPQHYNTGSVECIDAIKAMLTFEEFVGYLRGNSLKYRWRFRYKNNPISDLAKAAWYEERLLNFYTMRGEKKGGQKGGKNS
jgi:hypothetical protein